MKRTRDNLQALKFKALFNELGWNRPQQERPEWMVIEEISYSRRAIAELSGVVIFEIEARNGKIPDARQRMTIYKAIEPEYHENLLIFLDGEHTQSLWYWVKHEGSRPLPREHLYAKGQPGDLSLGKLQAMVFDIGEFDQEGIAPGVLEVARRLRDALDVERVTKKFYEEYKAEHLHFMDEIGGIEDERDRRWYASVLLNRFMFIYFLQRKGFIDHGNYDYLRVKLAESQERGSNLYYSEFLQFLFFEGFAKPMEERSAEAQQLLGEVIYLNGGLFLPHPIEKRWPAIQIPDGAFEQLLALFSRYSWNLDDAPGGQDDEISPHVLGYIFEKYINQKSFGAYYTRPEITDYLCKRSIHTLVLKRINALDSERHFETIEELLLNLNKQLCRDLLNELPKISLLDPACGSGAFLVSAMNTLIDIYSIITGRIEFVNDYYLARWLAKARAAHPSLHYYFKKKIITDNLFGVDVMEEGTEIAKLRLFLALVASVQSVEQLEPLPNIDFNILPGNSLIGLLQVDEERLSQTNLFKHSYHYMLDEKEDRIRHYRDAATYTRDLRELRDGIQTLRDESSAKLNELLLADFNRAGIFYEEATWDSAKASEGRPLKRTLTVEDIQALHPFHWAYEFDGVINERRGFDIIITNPPWEILKPQAKEFFNLHSKLVSKNKMRIEDFEAEKAKLLQSAEIREAWLDYQSQFPHQSAYFRTTAQYANQISTINGKKQGTDINLYKLFTEQCYNLLRKGGSCGIVIPSGIYTDLGAKQLRELLFTKTQLTGLFCFENRKAIFENVDSRFKFVVLTFEKGGQTESFPAAFMRHEVKELERFPRVGALPIVTELVRDLSPDSLSVMEFKSEMDVTIARKMIHFPLLGEKLVDTWNVALSREFDMTNDARLFKTSPAEGRLPLYEGKMIHQFSHRWSTPRYWIDADKGRNELLLPEMRRVETALDALAVEADVSQKNASRRERVTAFLEKLEYLPLSTDDIHIAPDAPRLAFRDIARNTDERTLIATILPANVFAGNTLNYLVPWHFAVGKILEHPAGVKACYEPRIPATVSAYLCGVFNSFTLDYLVRFKVTAHVNMFYLYQLPVPRITEQNAVFGLIVERVAKLICTTEEFEALWNAVLPAIPWSPNVVAVGSAERERLRAELDGIIAHLYGLTEEEFRHILETFPLVEQRIKDAALAAYADFALPLDDLVVADLIKRGENDTVEFKVAACWSAYYKMADKNMRENIIQAVAAFMNTDGGTVVLGVADNGTVVGLEEDYKAANPQPKKQNRDGYQLWLNSVLLNALGKEIVGFFSLSFHTVQGKEVCCITVEPATQPVYVRDTEFYVRNGNSKQSLNMKEAITYIKQHWG